MTDRLTYIVARGLPGVKCLRIEPSRSTAMFDLWSSAKVFDYRAFREVLYWFLIWNWIMDEQATEHWKGRRRRRRGEREKRAGLPPALRVIMVGMFSTMSRCASAKTYYACCICRIKVTPRGRTCQCWAWHVVAVRYNTAESHQTPTLMCGGAGQMEKRSNIEALVQFEASVIGPNVEANRGEIGDIYNPNPFNH